MVVGGGKGGAGGMLYANLFNRYESRIVSVFRGKNRINIDATVPNNFSRISVINRCCRNK